MQQLTTGRVRGYPAATAGEPMSGDRVPPQEAPTRRTRAGRRGRATSRTSVRPALLAAVPVPRGLRTVGYLTALAVWTLPVLTPAGPGNTAVPDATMAAALIMTILWLYRYGKTVALPYCLGIGTLMIAGLTAAVHQRAALAGLPVLQDFFLLLFAAGVANAVQRPWAVSYTHLTLPTKRIV